jgi:hypothetical protein
LTTNLDMAAAYDAVTACVTPVVQWIRYGAAYIGLTNDPGALAGLEGEPAEEYNPPAAENFQFFADESQYDVGASGGGVASSFIVTKTSSYEPPSVPGVPATPEDPRERPSDGGIQLIPVGASAADPLGESLYESALSDSPEEPGSLMFSATSTLDESRG